MRREEHYIGMRAMEMRKYNGEGREEDLIEDG